MIVILCHADDEPAVWLERQWRGAGVDATLVTVEELVYSRRIVHRMTDSGDSGAIEISNGRTIRVEEVSGLVNRIRYLPVEHFARADRTDRQYAAAELSAFLLGWLSSLPGRVVNPALPTDLGGGGLTAALTFHSAATVGLPTGGWRSAASVGDLKIARTPATHSVVVFDGRVYGPILPKPLQTGAGQLATLLGLPLLQVFFAQTRSAWQFVDATASADLRVGGRPLATAIAQAMAP